MIKQHIDIYIFCFTLSSSVTLGILADCLASLSPTVGIACLLALSM